MWQPLLRSKLYKVPEKGKKVGNNGLVEESLPECIPINYKDVHAITPCNVEQVLYTKLLPYLGVGVKQAVSLVGEDLHEGCNHKTIRLEVIL